MLPRGGRGGAAAAGGIGASQGDDDDIHDGDTIEMINLQAVKQETVLKILLVGGKQVGKTSFIRRFADKPFLRQYVPTVGFDLIVIPVFYAGRKVYLHFWDVAHDEVNASPSHHALLCHNVAGVFYVLDVTSRESLEAVDAWHSLLARYIPTSPRVPRVLLGHKADLPQSSYVVSDRALDAFVRDAGLTDWCYTVGHEEFGDYVAHRGFESKSVADAVHMLVDHIFKQASNGGASPVRRRPGGGLEGGHYEAGWSDDPAPVPGPMDAHYWRAARTEYGRGGIPCNGPVQPPQGWLPSVDIGELCARSRKLLSPSSGGADRGSTVTEQGRVGTGGGAAVERREEEAPNATQQAEAQPERDVGWRHYAGWIDREEAMRLLEKQPVGAFLLRRKNEFSLVLTYKTQSSIEHAPIFFDGTHWSPEPPNRPSRSPSLPQPPSSSPFSLPSTPQRPHSHSAAPQPPSLSTLSSSRQAKFETLEALLRYFSRKASVPSLTFRRKPGTCEYEVIKPQTEEGQRRQGGAGWGWSWGSKKQDATPPPVVDKAGKTTTDAPKGDHEATPLTPTALVEKFVTELEAVVLALNAQEQHSIALDGPAGEEEGVDGDGQLDISPQASPIGGVVTLGGSGGERRDEALLHLCKQTQHLLLSTLQLPQPHGEAPRPPSKGDRQEPQMPLKGPGLAVAIRRLEGLTDAVLALHGRQPPVITPGASEIEHADKRRAWEQARRCLQAWRPLLRVLRLRIEGLSATTVSFLAA